MYSQVVSQRRTGLCTWCLLPDPAKLVLVSADYNEFYAIHANVLLFKVYLWHQVPDVAHQVLKICLSKCQYLIS